MARRHLAIHGHFYQPPRENPWTERVPVEPTAAPFHDWNERITAECYRPNAHARIVDDGGLVLAVVNDFELLSFNLGPTLAAWLEQHDPHVYAHVVEADRRAGSAIAQAYNHTILPLANARDIRTQVRWGLADFTHRFGRRPEGMWLPECAVSDEVLAVLVEEGLRFTILGHDQAADPVPPGGTAWWEHPDGSGRRIALVFFDHSLSHDVAFGINSMGPQALVERAQRSAHEGLVCIATDGETFGHHHKFSERAIAYALAVEAPRRGVGTGPIARYLDRNPPTRTVRVRVSAWSCAHGIERWRSDCGCTTGAEPGWRQAWRTPLREALDLLNDHAARVYEELGAELFHDPWRARDAYIHPLLIPASLPAFAREQLIEGTDLVRALTLLEVQRHALLMYTSCGWFFGDLANLETVQVLRYAARCMDLLREVGDEPPEDDFLAVLGRAWSNNAALGNGRQVWERQVLAARVTPERVVAHLALSELLERRAAPDVLGGHEVRAEDVRFQDRGSLSMVTGPVTLVNRRTRRKRSFVVAAVHLGGLDVVGAVRPTADAAKDAQTVDQLREAFAAGEPLTSLVRRVGEGFGPHEFDVRAALPDAPGQLLRGAADALADRFGLEFERLVADYRPTFAALASAGYPLPIELRTPAQLALARRLEADLVALELSFDRVTMRSVEVTLEDARELGVVIDTPKVRAAVKKVLDGLAEEAAAGGRTGHAEGAVTLLALCRRHEIPVDVEFAQETVYRALQRSRIIDGPLAELGRALGLAVGRLGVPK